MVRSVTINFLSPYLSILGPEEETSIDNLEEELEIPATIDGEEDPYEDHESSPSALVSSVIRYFGSSEGDEVAGFVIFSQ